MFADLIELADLDEDIGQLLLQNGMPLFYADGERSATTWSEVDQSKVTSHEKLKSHEKLSLMTFDEIRSWEKEQSVSPLLRTPPLKKRRKGINFQGKNLYADFFHADCVDDHFDVLDNWSYKDVYGGGCFDVSGSFKGFDCIEEPVGCDDGSLPVKIKDEFKNEIILDDVVSSPANLSMLLKRKVIGSKG
nr:hypothetical protein [Tanacetum cinerariifolium]GEX75727.1 hypothetical protein [Tanacetum cinerariifolium]